MHTRTGSVPWAWCQAIRFCLVAAEEAFWNSGMWILSCQLERWEVMTAPSMPYVLTPPMSSLQLMIEPWESGRPTTCKMVKSLTQAIRGRIVPVTNLSGDKRKLTRRWCSVFLTKNGILHVLLMESTGNVMSIRLLDNVYPNQIVLSCMWNINIHQHIYFLKSMYCLNRTFTVAEFLLCLAIKRHFKLSEL